MQSTPCVIFCMNGNYHARQSILLVRLTIQSSSLLMVGGGGRGGRGGDCGRYFPIFKNIYFYSDKLF